MKTNRFSPLIMALCVAIGVLLGAFYTKHFGGNKLNIIGSGSNKLTNLLRIIEEQYVDTANIDSIVERTIPMVLTELDPHSVYFTAERAEAEADLLHGSFFGVGVQFTVRDDTVRIQSVVPNGPAESVGILAGDKIVTVDGENFTGKSVTSEEVQRRLKGAKGTRVTIGVLRYGERAPIEFTVTRDEIPQNSVIGTYMLDDKTGYIHITSFGETTYTEIIIALATLVDRGMQSLILDLRDNGGGYLQSAVQIANEFLTKNSLIVYTEGRRSKREDYCADGHGSYQRLPLVVLINESSASSAEILAGALQDNDRATIVGRRSFGKGLVQQEISFADKSKVRLTVARYYTPSGRCIQKPYTAGDEDSYMQDLVNRYNSGEFFSEDSIKHTGKTFYTRNGRLVYAGGGITPDLFVAEDTTCYTSYYRQAVLSGLVQQFAYAYTDNHRPELKGLHTWQELKGYLLRQNIVEKFVSYAEQHDLKRRNLMITKSHALLERQVISRIIYNMLSDDEWNAYINEDDDVVKAAKEVVARGDATPAAPTSGGQ